MALFASFSKSAKIIGAGKLSESGNDRIKDRLSGYGMDFPFENNWVIVCADPERYFERPALWKAFVIVLYRNISLECICYRVNISLSSIAVVINCAGELSEEKMQELSRLLKGYVESRGLNIWTAGAH